MVVNLEKGMENKEELKEGILTTYSITPVGTVTDEELLQSYFSGTPKKEDGAYLIEKTKRGFFRESIDSSLVVVHKGKIAVRPYKQGKEGIVVIDTQGHPLVIYDKSLQSVEDLSTAYESLLDVLAKKQGVFISEVIKDDKDDRKRRRLFVKDGKNYGTKSIQEIEKELEKIYKHSIGNAMVVLL